MAVLERARSVTETLTRTAKRQANRAKLELQVRQLERRLNSEYAQLGRTVAAALRSSDAVHASHPDVAASLRAIDELNAELAEKRRAIQGLGEAEGTLTAEGGATAREHEPTSG